MQIKIKKCYIIHIILLFIIFLFTGCKKPLEEDKKINYNTESSIKPEPTIEKDVIVFSNFVIESETRKILNKPTGDITKEDVLNITDFSIEGIYDDFDENEKSEKIPNEISSLADLKWFKNLKVLVLSGCNIKSLDGIEELTSLYKLNVKDNQIESIEPVRELTNLTYFDCSNNNIEDYSALSGLTKMKKLYIGYNGIKFTDLSPLANLTQLRKLYAPWCGISDISVLHKMHNLKYLEIFHNNIKDISVLNDLKEITYLDLAVNKIKDIKPIFGLNNLRYIDIQGNPIPKKAFKNYKPKKKDYFITTFYKKIRNDMPKFSLF